MVSLLEYIGLKPEIVHVTALPFIQSTNLPRTKMLLTTIARSFVGQDGFNVTQGGSEPDNPQQVCGYAEQKNVYHTRDFLRKNLSVTL